MKIFLFCLVLLGLSVNSFAKTHTQPDTLSPTIALTLAIPGIGEAEGAIILTGIVAMVAATTLEEGLKNLAKEWGVVLEETLKNGKHCPEGKSFEMTFETSLRAAGVAAILDSIPGLCADIRTPNTRTVYVVIL